MLTSGGLDSPVAPADWLRQRPDPRHPVNVSKPTPVAEDHRVTSASLDRSGMLIAHQVNGSRKRAHKKSTELAALSRDLACSLSRPGPTEQEQIGPK
jgi:hypothetical protein